MGSKMMFTKLALTIYTDAEVAQETLDAAKVIG